MKRGEVWTVSGGRTYAGKPRPAVVVQDDRFEATDSVTVCPFTTGSADAPLFRLPVEPTRENGLRVPCRIMVDKVTTVPRTRMGRRLGVLAVTDMIRVERAMMVFLGLAG
ncbi:MAG: type II toxin-antitoxin system PemK/MazF family toxin [Acidobacteria bacterium]|nr:type II toxin-antitoxin system PemK/MazF family toxin [Acidobacteriota bacterium]